MPVNAFARGAIHSLEEFGVGSESQERPTIAVHVVLQIEHAWKPGPSGFMLSPRTIRILRLDQVLNPALERRPVWIIERAKAHNGPRGLGSGAGTLPFKYRVVVSIAAFTPATVGMLHAFEPITRL